MRQRLQWLVSVGLVLAIAIFTASGVTYANGTGCKLNAVCEFGGENGVCGYKTTGSPGACYCDVGDDEHDTCDCATGEFPPCSGLPPA